MNTPTQAGREGGREAGPLVEQLARLRSRLAEAERSVREACDVAIAWFDAPGVDEVAIRMLFRRLEEILRRLDGAIPLALEESIEGAGRRYSVAEARAALAAVSASDHPVVPAACLGKWVAWSPDGMRIVAVGRSRRDVERAVARRGLGAVAYEKLRPPPRVVTPKAEG